MNTTHNRIKVSDLETSDPDKILMTNSSGELEFNEISNLKTDNYNGLDYTQEGKALDARQGKILKNLIDNKVDKVSGERLINAAEIAKISTIGNFVSTVKTISSTALLSQNISGFINYINNLTTILTIASNETVTYKTSDTGRVFELLLRGRSFGTGQSPITSADVIEITDFLNKDITLSNYIQTRNDGALPTNKVLSVNSSGKLGLYTIGLMPAPYLEDLVPFNQLPNTTFNIFLHGSYFTPNMTVAITGQTVNSVIFKNSNLVLVNVTTGSTEGLCNIVLNNGTSATFTNAMLVVLGTVYTPTTANFKVLTGSATLDNDSIVRTNGRGIVTTAEFDYIIPAGQNFRVTGKATRSPLYINDINNSNLDFINLLSMTNVMKYKTMISVYATINNNLNFYQASTGGTRQGYLDNIFGLNWYIQRIGTTVTVVVNNILRHTFTDASNEDLKINLGVHYCDWSVKYIALYQ